jgi:hypothetical protein
MEELTAFEIGSRIGISTDAARKRLSRLSISPSRYIGPTAMYNVDENTLELIRQHGTRGRPKANPAPPVKSPQSIATKKNMKSPKN